MKTKYITYGIFAFIVIIGYTIFLGKRDKQMFKAYDACTQFINHPDCPYKK